MQPVNATRRKALYLAIFDAAALPWFEERGTAGEPVEKSTQSFPQRGWAHRDGRIKLSAGGALRSPRQLLDHALIQESFAHCGIAYDEARVDILSALFTTDAVVELGHGSGKAFATLRGRDSIVANFEKALGHQHDQRRHFFTNIILDTLTATAATAFAYEVVTIADRGLKIGATVVCPASLRKSAQGLWQFSRMFIGMDDYI